MDPAYSLTGCLAAIVVVVVIVDYLTQTQRPTLIRPTVEEKCLKLIIYPYSCFKNYLYNIYTVRTFLEKCLKLSWLLCQTPSMRTIWTFFVEMSPIDRMVRCGQCWIRSRDSADNFVKLSQFVKIALSNTVRRGQSGHFWKNVWNSPRMYKCPNYCQKLSEMSAPFLYNSYNFRHFYKNVRTVPYLRCYGIQRVLILRHFL